MLRRSRRISCIDTRKSALATPPLIKLRHQYNISFRRRQTIKFPGLLIHEGQLTYSEHNLHKIVDLGEWWYDITRLPLPLGGNVIRRDIGKEDIREISRLLRESIQYALDHRKEALDYAMQFARDLDTKTADRFVGMYVNERTISYGDEGRRAVQELFDRAYDAKLFPSRIHAEFTD